MAFQFFQFFSKSSITRRLVAPKPETNLKLGRFLIVFELLQRRRRRRRRRRRLASKINVVAPTAVDLGGAATTVVAQLLKNNGTEAFLNFKTVCRSD